MVFLCCCNNGRNRYENGRMWGQNGELDDGLLITGLGISLEEPKVETDEDQSRRVLTAVLVVIAPVGMEL